jgi:hypothetical protein
VLRQGAFETRWLVPSFATGDGKYLPLPWRPDGKAAEQLRNAAIDRGCSGLWFPVSSPPRAYSAAPQLPKTYGSPDAASERNPITMLAISPPDTSLTVGTRS